MEGFLRERKISEDVIERFREEKIDENIVSVMTDEQLVELGIVHFGDRIAIKAFAKSGISKPGQGGDGLLERIKDKLENRKKHWKTLAGNKNAAKKQRRVEVGWMHTDENKKTKQVRAKTGGGTRHVLVDYACTIEDVKNKAVELFFPDGHSRERGSINEFEVKMTNFDQSDLKFSDTVEEVYNKTKVKILRLYLSTSVKNIDESNTDMKSSKKRSTKDNLFKKSSKKINLVTLTKNAFKEASDISVEDETLPDPFGENVTMPDALMEKETVTVPGISGEVRHFKTVSNISREDESQSNDISEEVKTGPDISKEGKSQPDNISGNLKTLPGISVEHVTTPYIPVGHGTIPDNSTKDTCIYSLHSNPIREFIPDLSYEEIQFISMSDTNSLAEFTCEADDTITYITVNLKLHRGQVLGELEEFFMENEFDMRQQFLHISMVLPNGEIEQAEDNGGVLRDALTEYWSSFYLQRTVGNKLKVPSLTHSVDGRRWKAVAKIMKVGYYYEKYFPAELATCFLEYSLNGDTIPKEILLAQFLQYLPENESKIAEMCLTNFSEVDEDDLLDFLGDHQVKTRPTRDNIQTILEDLSHKELIQSPTYVADCWQEEMKNLKPLIAGNFLNMTSLMPTFKGVWQTLSFDDGADTLTVSYLKKYLKELKQGELKDFLRFCTGADILLDKKITVKMVTPQSEFSRRPVAHTCGCTLEVPNSYSSFVELRNDFSAILNSSVWLMDIV